MKWHREPPYVRRVRIRKQLQEWHPWFAWHPVTLSDDFTRVWLEVIERKVSYWWGENHHIPTYEYRIIEK